MTSNPQKLAGQCGKLKCCLNYEYDVYTDALKEFPDMNIRLHTEKGDAIHQKSDVFKRTMWYSYINDQSNLLPLSVDTVNQIISDNKKGLIPKSLEDLAVQTDVNTNDVGSALQEEDIHRFDKKEDKSKRRPKRRFSPDKQKGQSTTIQNKEKTGGSKPSPADE